MVGLISALILIPLVGALALFTAPGRNARPIALLVNALAAFDGDTSISGLPAFNWSNGTHGFPRLAPNTWSGSTV